MKTRVAILAVFTMTLTMSVDALEVNKQSCLDAITSLKLPSDPYEFKDGWLGDKHIFGGTVECSEKRGQLFITKGRATLVEDGFFGPSILLARDKALAIQKKKNEKLKEERDKLIENARESHKASLAALEDETQQQLQQIREGGLPASITMAIEAEELERKEAEKIAVIEKTEREAEREAKKEWERKRAVIAKDTREAREAEYKIEREAKREEERVEREAREQEERERKEVERLASIVREENCRQELDCWGEKAGTYASIYCPKHIERLAKNEHEWTDGFLGAKFTKYRWSNKEAGIVTLIGDSLKFQNGFGAMVNVVYECDVNPELGEVINVRVSEGKL